MVRYSIAWLASLLGCGLVLGCASKETPPHSPTSANAEPSTLVAPAPPRGEDTVTPTSGSIHIDPKIQQACGNLPTPHFAFDSSDIRATARDNLEALSLCFTTGPLKGRKLRLVGHADPRGKADYNMDLGEKRAMSVEEFLTTHGVSKAVVETSSKGEFEAQGVDEEGWARDRKVEISLVE